MTSRDTGNYRPGGDIPGDHRARGDQRVDDGSSDSTCAGHGNPEAGKSNAEPGLCCALEPRGIGVDSDETAIVTSKNAVDGADLTRAALDLVEMFHDHLLVGGGDLEAEPALLAGLEHEAGNLCGLQFTKLVVSVDREVLERGVVHDFRVPPLQRVSDQCYSLSHEVILIDS